VKLKYFFCFKKALYQMSWAEVVGNAENEAKQEQTNYLFEALTSVVNRSQQSLPDADKLKLAGIDEMIASLSDPASEGDADGPISGRTHCDT